MKLTAIEGQEGYTCTPATCHPACALNVIDELLRASWEVRGEEVDSLLDLRSNLNRRQNAEGALGLFCALHRTLGERHYLAFYRLRRWLENQVEAVVRLRRGEPEKLVPLRLERCDVEAVRQECLKRAVANGEVALSPRIRFEFRSPLGVDEPVSERPAAETAPT
jgi:hypothetical protein